MAPGTPCLTPPSALHPVTQPGFSILPSWSSLFSPPSSARPRLISVFLHLPGSGKLPRPRPRGASPPHGHPVWGRGLGWAGQRLPGPSDPRGPLSNFPSASRYESTARKPHRSRLGRGGGRRLRLCVPSATHTLSGSHQHLWEGPGGCRILCISGERGVWELSRSV